MQAVDRILFFQEIHRIGCEFRMEDIAHDDIQIRILGVMVIIQIAHFDETGIMTEFRRILRFCVDDRRLRIRFLQNLGARLGTLARFHQLPPDESRLFVFRDPRATREAMVFFFRDEFFLQKKPPESTHFFLNVLDGDPKRRIFVPIERRAQGIAILFLRIDRFLHEHAIVEAVIPGDGLRINMVDIIPIHIKKVADVNRISRICRSPHLRVIQIQFIAAKCGFITFLQIFRQFFHVHMESGRLFFAIFVERRQPIFSGNGFLSFFFRSFCHFDENFGRRFPQNGCDFADDFQRLPQRPTNGR